MVATQPKHWTYEDLFGLPEGRYEIIEGELYQMPAPSWEHAIVIANLLLFFGPMVRTMGGRVVTAPVDVFMAGANPVQPDIVVLLGDRLHLASRRGVEGAPSLLVEVLSPSNPGRDREIKRRLYARNGVPEYWIVDPETQSIEVLVLHQGRYRRRVLARGDDAVSSSILPGLSFPALAAFA